MGGTSPRKKVLHVSFKDLRLPYRLTTGAAEHLEVRLMSDRSSPSLLALCRLMLGMPLIFLVAFAEGMAGPLHGIASLFSQGQAGTSGVYSEALINWLIEA